MKLRLVKQGDFLGTKCDFYTDESGNIFMSRTQVGYALQYKQPQHAILMDIKDIKIDWINFLSK